jgi:hypothetical protein
VDNCKRFSPVTWAAEAAVDPEGSESYPTYTGQDMHQIANALVEVIRAYSKGK